MQTEKERISRDLTATPVGSHRASGKAAEMRPLASLPRKLIEFARRQRWRFARPGGRIRPRPPRLTLSSEYPSDFTPVFDHPPISHINNGIWSAEAAASPNSSAGVAVPRATKPPKTRRKELTESARAEFGDSITGIRAFQPELLTGSLPPPDSSHNHPNPHNEAPNASC